MSLAESFRLGMRRLASGVSVITTQKNEQRYAMTASSITSLTDSPPSLLVCVNESAGIQSILVKGQPFVVNILGNDQQDVSNKCAEKEAGDERFAVGDWAQHEQTGIPYLTGAQAIFICEVDADVVQYGTHRIVIGRISEIQLPNTTVDPLIYVNGRYRVLADA